MPLETKVKIVTTWKWVSLTDKPSVVHVVLQFLAFYLLKIAVVWTQSKVKESDVSSFKRKTLNCKKKKSNLRF